MKIDELSLSFEKSRTGIWGESLKKELIKISRKINELENVKCKNN